ncbi:diguanylate cyclase [Massilia forsythiae]|uniref:diguanylate cyclase n=1 Tax=Massilia forsythiae TaxID=2728020 RepID=A0A7Z2ZRL2_9BURK|nr:diguanylate cyclase [Massilia forsythiae]QJD99590.1 diguanylate cyclase [Massilia forsythiae]
MRNEKQVKLLAAVVFAILALAAALPFWLNRSNQALLDAAQREGRQQQRLERMLDLLRDAESSERAYVITGKDAFLASSLQARQALAPALQQIKDGSRSGSARVAAWRIARLAELKQAEIDGVIAVRRQDEAAARAMVGAMRGRDHMEELRRLVALETARMAQDRDAGYAGLVADSQRSACMGAAAVLLAAGLLGGLLPILLRMLRVRAQGVRALEARAAQLGAAADLAARRNRELKLIAAMLRAVDAAPSSTAAAPLVGRYAARLMPGLSGSLYLLREDGALRRHAQWGDGPAHPAEMALDACRALRRDTAPDPSPSACHDGCNGAEDELGGRTCLPLVSHEELVGMMVVQGLSSDPRQQEQQERLAQAVAEQLALALGNAKLRESLRRQSVLDPLTGLYNRRHFDETLARELARARRKAAPLSLLVLDIDHFKQVNDRHGHAAGDAVLRTIAQRIRAWGREGDVACRYGGEEFVMLLPECAVEAAAVRADALRRAIESMTASPGGGGPEQVTASIGVAAWPDQGDGADALFWAADKALYRAKQQGRNRVTVAGAEDR